MRIFQFILFASLSLFLGKVDSFCLGKVEHSDHVKTELKYSSHTQIQPFSSSENSIFLIDAETESEDDDETNIAYLFTTNTFTFSPSSLDLIGFRNGTSHRIKSTVKRFILYCSLKLDC